jgi:uncharacterized repeat protein (TIGR03803 family)
MTRLRSLACAIGFPLTLALPLPGQAANAEADTAPASQAATEVPAPDAFATGLNTLYRFPSGPRGRWPRGGVAVDEQGNVYGTTLYDGDCSTCGIVYKLAPKGGGWTFTALRLFKLGHDGIGPVAPLTLRGNMLYGAASAGGNPHCGCGLIFRIGTNGKGYKVLHKFGARGQGWTPIGGLLIDGNGTIYGTTSSGGAHDAGVLFKLPTGGGYSILHHFTGDFNGGPQGDLIFGADGAIYGTQFGGGRYNQGTVFRMTKGGSFTVLHHFLGVDQPGNSTDGAHPEGRLALAANGAIYGTTTFGGTPSGYGTAWSVQEKNGRWVYKQIHIFTKKDRLEANTPHSGLVFGPGGDLYGIGSGGGKWQGGAIYRFAKSGADWIYKTLYSFRERTANGDVPWGYPTVKNGIIYSTALSGGKVGAPGCIDGCGTTFAFKP